MRSSMAWVAVVSLGVLGVACGSDPDAASGCAESGGTVVTVSCCAGAHAFPDTCAVGACSCSPENLAPVQSCQCPDLRCFDGTSCVRPPVRGLPAE